MIKITISAKVDIVSKQKVLKSTFTYLVNA
jgi:hypothetical protein